MKKIAIIDVGTNSTRLVLLSINDNGGYKVIDEIKESVRLGQDMGEECMIKPRRIAQLIMALQMFRRLCDNNGVDEIIAIATSAVRRARNQRSFLDQVYAETGIELKVLTGEQVGHYVYVGVSNTVDVDNAVIVEIGGGSMEIMHMQKRALKNIVSIPYGSVNLTEKFQLQDKISDEQAKEIEDFIYKQLDAVPWLKNLKGLPLVGVGGAFRNIGKIMMKKSKYSIDVLHNYELSFEAVENVYKEVLSMNLDRRIKIKGLSNERADIFVGAAAAVTGVMRFMESDKVIISTNGQREGILYAYINPAVMQKPTENVLDFGLQNMMDLYVMNPAHAYKVYDLTQTMFEQLRQLHKLPPVYGKIIKTAALLHDCGTSIRYYDHQKNSYYLIINSEITGLSHKEIVLSALIALLHRKEMSTREIMRHSDILTEKDHETIIKLSVLLRIAESLDRSMSGLIGGISCDILGDSVIVKTFSEGDLTLEIKDALKSAALFEKAYGKNLIIL